MDSRESRRRYKYRRRQEPGVPTSSRVPDPALNSRDIPARRDRHRSKGAHGPVVLAALQRFSSLRLRSGRAADRLRSVAGPLLAGTGAGVRRYSTQLTALAGIVVVVLSVYLIQQGSLVPSTYHFGGDPGATAGGAAGAGAVDIPAAEGPGDGADGGSPGSPASSVAPDPLVTGADAASTAGDAVTTVIDLEGERTIAYGPLSRDECLKAMVSPATGELLRPWGPYWSELLQRWEARHPGVDIALNTGDQVRAALGGLVTRVEARVESGWVVEISHGYGVVTVYAHLGAVHVRAGDMVNTGGHIGTAGLPGELEFDLGVHLHFEIRVDGESVDPQLHLDF